jgi:hypothetical protein
MRACSERAAAAALSVLLAAAPGCVDDPPRGRSAELDGDIRFQIREAYGRPGRQTPEPQFVGEPRLLLSLWTEREYSCANWGIVYRCRAEQDGLRVDLPSRSIDDFCLTAFGPATAAFFVDLDPGDQRLVLSKPGGGLAGFQVSVSPQAVRVSPDSAGFASTPARVYWRYPPRSFACLCGTTTETSWMCDDFVGRLQAAVELEEIAFPDSGLAPYPRASSGHWFEAPGRYFRYGSEADFAAASTVLQDYAREVIGTQQGIGISLHSWRNEHCLSWLYDQAR